MLTQRERGVDSENVVLTQRECGVDSENVVLTQRTWC